ncbi:MAG: hypothetical protein IBJ10_00005 [Phycisphaerales bacterium]|nr:hypothetical protein [Phycisphaerales bacterium]
MGRRLGLDKTLAWKVARFVEGADPVAAVRHMPGAGGVEIIVRAAEAQRVSGAILERVRLADRDLREFVSRHAGDRRAFEAMLSGELGGARNESDERRAYFRSGSALWGVRAKLQFLMLALAPSADRPGRLDAAQVSGFVDFERLRPDLPWIVRRLRAHSDSGADVYRVIRTPLVAERARRGLPPLFDAHCSQPAPELRQFERENGWVYDELAPVEPGRVGRAGAITVVLGERYMGALPMERSEDNAVGTYTLTVRTPVECVLFDLLLHRDLTHFGAPRRAVYGLLEDRPPAGDRPAPLIDAAPAADLGPAALVQTHRWDRYPKLVDDALALAGFAPRGQFRGYRAEVDYPTFPCDLKMELEIGPTALR